MEVRAERKNRKHTQDLRRRYGIVLRIVLALSAVCLLAGGMVWKFGQKTTLAAGYNMEKGSDGRYIFNVVEVVPEKNQAVLGNFIGGKENLAKDNSLSDLLKVVKEKDWIYKYDCKNIFYWEGKTDSTGCEPFTVVYSSGMPVAISNNEIFKLRMLGLEKDTGLKNPVINEERKEILKTFDAQYVINYQVMTPKELESADISKIQYLQIGGGIQLSAYDMLYGHVTGNQSASWQAKYTVADQSDISWKTALELYDRAMSANSKMSISISGYCMESTDRSLNIYKLYQMLNYFDDPILFQNLYYDASKTNPYGAYTTRDSYIDRGNGQIHIKENGGAVKIDDSWNYLPNLAQLINLSAQGVLYQSSIDFARDSMGGNYIPGKYGNILLYKNSGGIGYFSEELSRKSVNTILNFDSSVPSPPVEEKRTGVRVLEIEPCNRYWSPSNRSQLAKALGMEGKEDEISLTCVTPNQLNGMAVDLTAEYDLIIVGDNVDLFGRRSGLGLSLYRQIGQLDDLFTDAVITDTLINGLMETDYTTKYDFDQLLKSAGINSQLETDSNQKILKNVGLTLELAKKVWQNPTNHVTKARFSGNDINKYMQKQLAEYVNSGQPVVMANSVLGHVIKQTKSFNDTDHQGKTSIYTEDSRLYFALAGIADETKHYSGDPIPELSEGYEPKLETIKTWTNTTPAVSLLTKPSVSITDIVAEGQKPSIAEQHSDTLDLNALSKSNTLSFNYDITLAGNINNYRMAVVIDRNGDGIFDVDGEGKTPGKNGVKGKQNNATDSIKNDKVYEVNFKDLIGSDMNGGEFTISESVISGNTVSGIFEAQLDGLDGPVEEFYEFRVIAGSILPNEKLRGVWTGYMRPDIAQKTKRVLQIKPYEDSTLLSDPRGKFQEVLSELTETAEDPEGEAVDKKADYELVFEDITESQFASRYGDGEAIKSLLDNYDLIIVGTDYSSSGGKNPIDLLEEKASDVLKQWMTQYQMPIIFTNDFTSYVNAENYVTPKKEPNSFQAVMRPMGGVADGRKKSPNVPINTTPLSVWEGWDSSGIQTTIQISPEEFSDALYDAHNGHAATDILKDAVRNESNTYYIDLSYMTEEEAKALYENGTEYWLQEFQVKLPGSGNNGQQKFTAYYKDIHSSLNQYDQIPTAWVDTAKPVVIAGDTYYKFTYPTAAGGDGKQYLAIKTNAADSYTYLLRNVAGTGDALYPEQGVWNYRATKSLRYALGMDRFAITQTDMKPEDKRDTGTCRRYQKVDEIQGFTNGALLEFAYPLDSKYDNIGRFSSFLYVDETGRDLPLGSKPRTNAIEKLNDGVIGHYPFEIAGDINNKSETKIKIQTNHPPLYELDLVREVGEGKIDDVTVWYTLGGSMTGSTQTEIETSKYFDLTAKDAGNNYYLYSKGKTYYTGFSLYEETEGETKPETDEQNMEMKLFINTIYAALTSTAVKNDNIYEAVVNPVGTVSNISRSTAAGTNNQYVCYYDEEDESLEFLFRIQKSDASDGEKGPVWLGVRENVDGVVKYKPFLPTDYKLPEGMSIEAFPVEKSPPTLAGGDTEKEQWYKLSIVFEETGIDKNALDGTTMMIAVAQPGLVHELNPNAIHAEIRLVKRNIFDLD